MNYTILSLRVSRFTKDSFGQLDKQQIHGLLNVIAPYFDGMVAFQQARCESNNYVYPYTDSQLLAYFIDEADLHNDEVTREGEINMDWIAYHAFWAAMYHAAATVMLAVGIVPASVETLFEQGEKD